ncbi:neurofilament heavy polypeptide-like [Penaeus japonicus]|uniref:neurofilament heavy polypeptide-like n=1 Tax=Penaeus japonicus TaxID=27405 RepID=UPI001C70C5AE|nr:neurofilament heavy polypeptide-like [Penaeus japonicus]
MRNYLDETRELGLRDICRCSITLSSRRRSGGRRRNQKGISGAGKLNKRLRSDGKRPRSNGKRLGSSASSQNASWNRSGPRVNSWATQELPGEGRRSGGALATNYHSVEIVRSREDLSQQWIRRPNGQEQRVHPGSDRRAKRPRSKEQRPRSIRPRMEVSAGKARAQEAQSAEARAPVKAWAPEEPPAEARASEEQPAEARAPEEPLIKVRAPEESPAEARAPEEPSPETRAATRDVCAGGATSKDECAGGATSKDECAGGATSKDELPGIGRPLEETRDVKCSPRGPSRMRCTSEDPPVESRSPEELLAEKESLPEEVFPAQLPRTSTQRIVMGRRRDRDCRSSADDGRAGPGATSPPSSAPSDVCQCNRAGARGPGSRGRGTLGSLAYGMMQVLHYIEQQEKIRREKEERAYQEQEKQRQEARKQRKLAERELKKRQLQREQEERALEERLRQKEDAQKAQQGAVGSPSWTCPEGCVCLSFPGWNRSGPRVNSWATQELPGEGRRSEELPATNYHPAEIVRSREDLSQCRFAARTDRSREYTSGGPTGEAASLKGTATAEYSPSDGGFSGDVCIGGAATRDVCAGGATSKDECAGGATSKDECAGGATSKDELPGIGRPLEETIDVKCSPRGPSRMRCTSEDPPVESRSPEELLPEKESLPEEVFPAQLPRTSTQRIVRSDETVTVGAARMTEGQVQEQRHHRHRGSGVGMCVSVTGQVPEVLAREVGAP